MAAGAVCATIGLILIIIGLTGIRVVKEYERGVVFRLGRLIGPKGPGIFYIIPIIDSMVIVDLRTITVDVPKQEVMTKDNISTEVDAVLYYQVASPEDAVNKVERFRLAIAQGAQSTVRNVIGQHTLNDLLRNRDKINHQIRNIIDEMSDPWGIKVTAVEIKDVNIPQTMQRAMAKEAEAEREKNSRIIKAEGELIATKNLQKAAKAIAENPSILELRRMQMVSEVGTENNTTTIVLMPSEFITAAKGIGEIGKMVSESEG
jgi:regulator of protease activity HflC (stomatin/prohibitin superfamily)